VVWT